MSKIKRPSGWAGFVASIVVCTLAPAVSAQTSTGLPAGSASARQMTDAAAAFVASLRPEQRAAAVYDFTGPNRTNWSNVPLYVHPRPGLRIRELTREQRRAVHALLRASLSSQGYQKIAGVMRLDDIHRERELAVLERNGPAPDDRPFAQLEAESFGAGSYAVAIFGEPGRASSWGWLIQGHHLGASFTVAGERATFTPLFLGATPLVLEDGIHAGWSALSHEVARGFELMASLDATQRAHAIEPGDVPGDVTVGVGHKDDLPDAAGLQASDMTPAQHRLLRALVEEYVRNADFDVAESQLEAIAETGWDTLSFVWRGATDDASESLYYRVQGERILIELSQRPNHIHAIVRDPTNDYGEVWLDERITEMRTANDRFRAAEQAHRQATGTR